MKRTWTNVNCIATFNTKPTVEAWYEMTTEKHNSFKKDSRLLKS